MDIRFAGKSPAQEKAGLLGSFAADRMTRIALNQVQLDAATHELLELHRIAIESSSTLIQHADSELVRVAVVASRLASCFDRHRPRRRHLGCSRRSWGVIDWV
jgi:hypothetical protein